MMLVGTLEHDPAAVAAAINRLLADDTRRLARSPCTSPVGHVLDGDDIAGTDRGGGPLRSSGFSRGPRRERRTADHLVAAARELNLPPASHRQST